MSVAQIIVILMVTVGKRSAKSKSGNGLVIQWPPANGNTKVGGWTTAVCTSVHTVGVQSRPAVASHNLSVKRQYCVNYSKLDNYSVDF